jgi:predicted deacylase
MNSMILRSATIIPIVLLITSCVAASTENSEWGSLSLLGQEVAPGSKLRTRFSPDESYAREVLDANVLILRGGQPGPTLCLTGAVHGDELNGVEIARRVFEESDAESVAGTVIAIPIVNTWGFRSGNRYVADRRDLNRAFPGKEGGSLASRIAFATFDRVIRHCDVLIDLHTGSADRSNTPQVRIDGANEHARELAQRFAVGIVLVGDGPEGSLRRASGQAGITVLLYEAGGPNRFDAAEIDRGVEGVFNVMEALRMLAVEPPAIDPQRYFESSTWVRADAGGIFLTDLLLGRRVEAGSVLGVVTDPVTSERFEIHAPVTGILIGMAFPQVVLPGYALFHIARSVGDPSNFSETE